MAPAPFFQPSNPTAPPILSVFLSTLVASITSQSAPNTATCLTTSVDIFLDQLTQGLRTELINLQYDSAIRNTVEKTLEDGGVEWNAGVEAVVAYMLLLKTADWRIMDSSSGDWGCDGETGEAAVGVAVNGAENPFQKGGMIGVGGGFSGGVNQGDDTTVAMRKWWSALVAYAGALNTAFNSAQGEILTEAVKRTAKDLVDLAGFCDFVTNDAERTHSNSLLTLIVRMFNSSIAGRVGRLPDGRTRWGKKGICLDLANCLFRLYDKLQENRLFPTILEHLNTASIPLSPKDFPKPTLILHHYHRGLFHLRNSSFLQARASLLSAFTLCHRTHAPQRRRILIPLLSTSLILGYLPDLPTLFTALSLPDSDTTDLSFYFIPLISSLRNGDFHRFRQALGQETSPSIARRRSFWEQHRLYHTLLTRCQPILWRNLCRNVYRVTANPAAKRKELVLRNVLITARALHQRALSADEAAARESAHRRREAGNPLFHQRHDTMQDDDEEETGLYATWWSGGIRELTMEDVQGVVLSLLDQGLVKGALSKTAMGVEVLVLSPKEPWPDMRAVWGGVRWGGGERGEKVPARGLEGRVVRMSGVKGIGEK